MDKESNIIDLCEYRKKGQSDIRTMVQIHNMIMELQNKAARMRLEAAWQEIAHTVFTDFCL